MSAPTAPWDPWHPWDGGSAAPAASCPPPPRTFDFGSWELIHCSLLIPVGQNKSKQAGKPLKMVPTSVWAKVNMNSGSENTNKGKCVCKDPQDVDLLHARMDQAHVMPGCESKASVTSKSKSSTRVHINHGNEGVMKRASRSCCMVYIYIYPIERKTWAYIIQACDQWGSARVLHGSFWSSFFASSSSFSSLAGR